MAAIKVTPEELIKMAGTVESWAGEYRTIVSDINNAANDLQQTWGGEANAEYVNRLNGFQDDFNRLDTLLRQFSDYLKSTGQKYLNTEETIKSSASSLSIGI